MKRLRRKRRVESPGPGSSELDCEPPSTRTLYELQLHTARLFQAGSFTNEDLGNLLRSHISFLEEQLQTGKDIFSDSPFFQDSFDLAERRREHPVRNTPANDGSHLHAELSPRQLLDESVRVGHGAPVLPPPQILFPETSEVRHPRGVEGRGRMDSDKIDRNRTGPDRGERRSGCGLNTMVTQLGENKNESEQRKQRSSNKIITNTHHPAKSSARNNGETDGERPLHDSTAKESTSQVRADYVTTGHVEASSPELSRKRKVMSGRERKESSGGDCREQAVKVRKRAAINSGSGYEDHGERPNTAGAVGPHHVPTKLPTNVESRSPPQQHMHLFPMSDRNSLIARPRHDENPENIDTSKVVEDSVNGTNNYISLPNPSTQMIPSCSNPLSSRHDVHNSLMSSTLHDLAYRNQSTENTVMPRSGSKNQIAHTTGGRSPQRVLRQSSAVHRDTLCTTEGGNQLKRRPQISLALEKGDQRLEGPDELKRRGNGELESENLGDSEETMIASINDRNETSNTKSVEFPERRVVEVVGGLKSLEDSYHGELYLESSPPLLPSGGLHSSDGPCSIVNGTENVVPYVPSESPDQVPRDGSNSIVIGSQGYTESAEGSDKSMAVSQGSLVETMPTNFMSKNSKISSQINDTAGDISARRGAPQGAHALLSNGILNDRTTMVSLKVPVDANGRRQGSGHNSEQLPGNGIVQEGNSQNSDGILEGVSAIDNTEKLFENEYAVRGVALGENGEGISVDRVLDSDKRLRQTGNPVAIEETQLCDGNLRFSSAAQWDEEPEEPTVDDKEAKSVGNTGAANSFNGEGPVILQRDSTRRNHGIRQEQLHNNLSDENNAEESDHAKPHLHQHVMGRVGRSSAWTQLKDDLTCSGKNLISSQLRESAGYAGGKQNIGQCDIEIHPERLNGRVDSSRTERYDRDGSQSRQTDEKCTRGGTTSSEMAGGADLCQEPPVRKAHEVPNKESNSDGIAGEKQRRRDTPEGTVNSGSGAALSGDVSKGEFKSKVPKIHQEDCTAQEKEKHVRFAIDARKICSPRTPGKSEATGNTSDGITAEYELTSSPEEEALPHVKMLQGQVHKRVEKEKACDESPTTTMVEKARQLITPVFEDFNEEEVRAFLTEMRKLQSQNLTDQTYDGRCEAGKNSSNEAESARIKAAHTSNRSKALVIEKKSFPASFMLWVGGTIEYTSPSEALDITLYRRWQEVELDSAAVSYALYVIEMDKTFEVCSESCVLTYMHSMKARVKGSWVREDTVLSSCRLGTPEKSYWYFIPLLMELKNEQQWALVCIQGLRDAFQSLLDFSSLEETNEDIRKNFGSVLIVLTEETDIPKLYLECIDKFIWGVLRSAYFTVQKDYPKVPKSRQIRNIVKQYMRNVCCVNLVKEHFKESSGAYIVSAAFELSTSTNMNRFHGDVLKRATAGKRKKNGSIIVRIQDMITNEKVAKTMDSTFIRVSTLLERLR